MKNILDIINIDISTKDVINSLWNKISEKYPGLQFDPDEDELFYLVDVGNTYDCPHSKWVKHKLTDTEGQIIKHIWHIKELL